MQRHRVSSVSTCVDDETLFSLARGELEPEQLAQVEAHLRDCSDCRGVLGEAARSLATAGDDATSSAGGPASIGRYQVQALLGAGASGVVYRALDPNLKRTVAIKVLRPDQHPTPELSARMLREAQAMARLSHPHVVAVYDVGLQDGAVYLVMEYVHGDTLSHWLQAAPRSFARILEVFADAGRGLLAAHEKGLVHLDFKPENVLVAADGRALVTDFGLAHEAELPLAKDALEDGEARELYGPTRGLVGTPAYMAPELFAGERATASSDQFAFCVALFSALFARHPFQAGAGISLAELVDKMRRDELEMPSSLGLAAGRSERLHAVLRRGLLADPRARFASLRELLSALDRAASTPWRRPLLGVALAAALLLAVVLGARTWSPRARDESTRAAPTQVSPPPEPPAAAVVAAPAALPEPAPVAAPHATSAPTPQGAHTQARRHRPARKKAEVRYRDWLKDPF
jgi:eukaryotic-like serine/threonine-protein kinase